MMKNKPGRSAKIHDRLNQLMAMVSEKEGIKKLDIAKKLTSDHADLEKIRCQVGRDQNTLVLDGRLFVQLDVNLQRFYTPEYAAKHNIPQFITPPAGHDPFRTPKTERVACDSAIEGTKLLGSLWRPSSTA